MTTQNNSVSNEVKGNLTFDDKVIQKIIGHAIENVKGLLDVDGGFISNIKNKLVNSDDVTDGIDVEVGKEQVAVDLKIIMEFGYNARNVYDELKKFVAKDINDTTNLDLIELNVEVADIQTKREYEQNSTTVQDKLSDVGSSIREGAKDSTESMSPDKRVE